MSSLEKKLRELRKKTGSESYANTKYGTITSWISAGDYGLNRAMSGSIHKGVPAGKIVQFAGESATGKSLIAAQVVINAIRDGYTKIFYVDSEGGMTRQFIESANVDMNVIEVIPVGSIEECHIAMLNIFKFIDEMKKEDEDLKFMFVVDSLGALIPNKLIEDATQKDKMAGEMGLAAKLKNSMLKSWVVPAGRTNTPILVVNHVYDDPSAMYASKIKNIGGGKQTAFMPHITIQCSKTLEKKDDKDEEQAYKGTVLKLFTIKNRCCKSFYETEMYLDYKTGFHKWWSLFKPAIQLGFIKKSGGWYEVPSYSDKKLRGTDILNNDEIWESFLDAFEEKSLEILSYSSPEVMDEESMDEYVDQIIEEAEAEEAEANTTNVEDIEE
jgi:RecA/RadA recombinase